MICLTPYEQWQLLHYGNVLHECPGQEYENGAQDAEREAERINTAAELELMERRDKP